ncbi:hypothetical protein M436DRAFT_77626 [Aureobasidium namibiae CBS 147.97]|uniref:C2H2-type domain-containing protein n=1 Tax=Aureobasidium namibiae CBS 147.97 TaxID=1043004 RepID=A0A074WX57_9PEZI
MSYACETCDRCFGSWNAARQHMDALDHWDDEDEFECDKCDRTFTTQAGCNQHMTALSHWYTDTCETCERRFVNKHAAEQHMDALNHHALPYCTSCERHFQKAIDLFQHMNSSIHIRADPINPAPMPAVSSVPASQPVVAASPAALPPAVVATQPMSSLLAETQLTKPCTTCIPFKAFIEKDTLSIMLHYQSITSMRSYQTFSFEELRFADYRAGCRPTNNGDGEISSVMYRDQSTQTDNPRRPASSVYVSATSSRANTPGPAIDDPGSIVENSTFSLSEIKSQDTKPVLRPKVLSCPFCHIGFDAVWQVAGHLETSSCPQRPDLNCSSIHRYQRQQDPNETMVLQISGVAIETHLYRCPNTAGGCSAKFMSSFTELIAHLESENCGFIKREELWKDISECKNLWEGIGDC